MILITCTNETRPADFEMLAQNPVSYELLGFSATGTEYTGDFSGFECRIGTSNELGEWSSDLENPVYTAPTNASVRTKFNAWQCEQRAKEYVEVSDPLAMEAYYEGTQAAKDAHTAAVDAIKAKYPKA